MVGRGWLVVLFAVCLLTAGCAEMTSESDTTLTHDRVVTETATPIPSPTLTETQTLTETTDPVDPDNPFGKKELTVVMVDNSTYNYDRATELDATLSYWGNNSQRFAGYSVDFERVNSTSDADIIVEFVDEVEVCGLEISLTRYLGCAPVPGKTASLPAVIKIDNRFTDEPTEETLKHEFGHVLGIEHGEEPLPLMAENTTAAPKEIEFTVAVEAGPDYHPTTINRQTTGPIGFFESGGNGTIASDVTISEVDDPDDAFIYMDVTGEQGACDGDIYCVDSELECYLNASCSVEGRPVITITTENIVGDQVGWVLAVEIAMYLEAEQALTEWPRELDPDEANPSNTWWR